MIYRWRTPSPQDPRRKGEAWVGGGGASTRSPVCCCWSRCAGGCSGGPNCSSGRTERRKSGREGGWGCTLAQSRKDCWVGSPGSLVSSLFLTCTSPPSKHQFPSCKMKGGTTPCFLEPLQRPLWPLGPHLSPLQLQHTTFNCSVIETSG